MWWIEQDMQRLDRKGLTPQIWDISQKFRRSQRFIRNFCEGREYAEQLGLGNRAYKLVDVLPVE